MWWKSVVGSQNSRDEETNKVRESKVASACVIEIPANGTWSSKATLDRQ